MTTAHSCGAGGQRSHATGGLPACPLQHHGRWRPERQRFLRAGHRFPAYGGLVSLEWEQVVVDARDPAALGRWWADALSWVIVNDSAEEFEIRPSPDRLPGLIFGPVPEAKQSKNRLHLDFRPDDQQAEVERFLRAGARRVDIGQGTPTWVVLADPEGNEFCVLSTRKA